MQPSFLFQAWPVVRRAFVVITLCKPYRCCCARKDYLFRSADCSVVQLQTHHEHHLFPMGRVFSVYLWAMDRIYLSSASPSDPDHLSWASQSSTSPSQSDSLEASFTLHTEEENSYLSPTFSAGPMPAGRISPADPPAWRRPSADHRPRAIVYSLRIGDRVYWGSSCRDPHRFPTHVSLAKRRFAEHRQCLLRGNHSSPRLQIAFEQAGRSVDFERDFQYECLSVERNETSDDFRKRYIAVEQARLDSDPLSYNASRTAGLPDLEACRRGSHKQPRSAKQKGGRRGSKEDKARAARMQDWSSKVEGGRVAGRLRAGTQAKWFQCRHCTRVFQCTVTRKSVIHRCPVFSKRLSGLHPSHELASFALRVDRRHKRCREEHDACVEKQ